MNNYNEKMNYLLAEIDRLSRRVQFLEKADQFIVDDELKDSPNAIQNSVVFSALSNKTETSDFSSHTEDANNPHAVTKSQVGLSDVDNTADSAKSVLSATKLSTARSIANVSFDGSANIDIPFNNLTNKPTTLSGYGISDAYTKSEADSHLSLKADKDASNLSSSNVTSWQTACNFERVETVFDQKSSNSALNWGYTNGIYGKNINISGKNFSKYKKLRVYAKINGDYFQISDLLIGYKGGVMTKFDENNNYMFSTFKCTSSTFTLIRTGYNDTNLTSTDYAIIKIEGVY